MRDHSAFEQLPAPRLGLGFNQTDGNDVPEKQGLEVASRKRSPILEGKSILIVEDEALLALTLADELTSLGCLVVGPFTSLAHALRAVKELEFDAAIMDVNLAGEFVYPVADELLARGVPFVFLTGYARASLPARLQACPHLLKPYNPVLLERELVRLMKARSS